MKFKRSKNIPKEVAITKEVPATSVAPNKVDAIIKGLSALEIDIESLNQKLAEMKKQLNQQAQKEIDQLQEKVTQIATNEAEAIIAEAREKANSEAQRIMTTTDVNLKDIQSKIDSKFNDAVEHVVLTVLRP